MFCCSHSWRPCSPPAQPPVREVLLGYLLGSSLTYLPWPMYTSSWSSARACTRLHSRWSWRVTGAHLFRSFLRADALVQGRVWAAATHPHVPAAGRYPAADPVPRVRKLRMQG